MVEPYAQLPMTFKGRKIANDAFINGARASGVTGSGPAVVIIIPSLVRSSAERIKSAK